MKYGKMMMGAMALAAIAASTESTLFDKTPRPRMDVSKSSSLSGKEIKKRKVRNKMARRSRKANRN